MTIGKTDIVCDSCVAINNSVLLNRVSGRVYMAFLSRGKKKWCVSKIHQHFVTTCNNYSNQLRSSL